MIEHRDRFTLWPTPWRKDARAPRLGGSLPSGLYRLIWRLSGTDQVWLCILSGLVAALNTVPIEIQRRVVDRSLKGGSFRSIPFFVLAYAAVVLLQGGVKFLFNVYRGWVSEHAVRTLRSHVDARQAEAGGLTPAATDAGTKVSMVVAESEPIGAFVGEAISEPVLQAGIMLCVAGYLVALEPVMMIVIAAVFAPQFVFIPLMQAAVTRRAEARIALLRSAGEAVVEKDDGANDRGEQERRFAQVFALNVGVFKFKYGMNFLTNLCHQLGIAGILGVGGWLVVSGRTQVGTVVAFISGLGTVKDPWDDLTTWYQTFMTTRARYRLLETTLRTQETPAGTDEGDAADAVTTRRDRPG